MRLKRNAAILSLIFWKNKSEDFLHFTESFYQEWMLNISISSSSPPTSYILLHHLKWALHSFLYQFGHFYRELKMSISRDYILIFFFLSLWIIFAPQQVRSPLWACVSYRNAFHIRYRQVEHTSCCAPSLQLFESSKVDPHNGMSELSGLAVYAGGHCVKGLIIKIFLIFHLRRLRHTFGCPV